MRVGTQEEHFVALFWDEGSELMVSGSTGNILNVVPWVGPFSILTVIRGIFPSQLPALEIKS